jgi:hypothetical protein
VKIDDLIKNVGNAPVVSKLFEWHSKHWCGFSLYAKKAADAVVGAFVGLNNDILVQ